MSPPDFCDLKNYTTNVKSRPEMSLKLVKAYRQIIKEILRRNKEFGI